MKRTTILLADDHALVREGLRMMLETEFSVVGAVGDGRSLLKEAERLNPDVALVDVSMPMMNGIEAARRLRKTAPQDRKSTRLNSSHVSESRMPSSA